MQSPQWKAPWRERNGKLSPLKLAVFVALFAPLIWIGVQALNGALAPKPVTEAVYQTGQWAIRLVLISLLVSPLRRIAQWPKLIAVRRMVGVGALAYAIGHFFLFIVEQKFDLMHVAAEIALRFYLTVGFIALLGLIALGVTSTDAMIRRLGGLRWNRLHKLVYIIAALGIFHFYLQAKADVSEPALMMGFYFILMLFRLLMRFSLPAWACVPGAALGAPALTALIEALWYAIVRHVDVWTVLAANLEFPDVIRPAVYVLGAGLAFAVVYVARNLSIPGVARTSLRKSRSLRRPRSAVLTPRRMSSAICLTTCFGMPKT